MREHCRRDNQPLIFKASDGWLLNFLKRNKWVLRRITTSGRDLPDNSIETILNFLVEMKQHFIDGKIDFDSIINMDETSIYLDFPSNYTYDASSLYEESDAEEEYEREKVLIAEVNKRLSEMGLSPNSLKKHKRQLKEKLIQKQIAFLSQKKSSSHRTATANPRHIQVNVTVNEAVNSNNSNKSNKAS
jgi:hypothetical protein